MTLSQIYYDSQINKTGNQFFNLLHFDITYLLIKLGLYYLITLINYIYIYLTYFIFIQNFNIIHIFFVFYFLKIKTSFFYKKNFEIIFFILYISS